jgi:hypothetical protein
MFIKHNARSAWRNAIGISARGGGGSGGIAAAGGSGGWRVNESGSSAKSARQL